MVAWAFSLAAAGLFAPLVLGIWWKRTTSTGAILGMICGFSLCLYYLIMTQYYAMPLWFGIRNISSALFGLPVAFLVTWAVSLVTTPPSKEMQDFVDSIREGAPVTLTNFEDGLHYMRIIDATRRSRLEGRAVQISEV